MKVSMTPSPQSTCKGDGLAMPMYAVSPGVVVVSSISQYAGAALEDDDDLDDDDLDDEDRLELDLELLLSELEDSELLLGL